MDRNYSIQYQDSLCPLPNAIWKARREPIESSLCSIIIIRLWPFEDFHTNDLYSSMSSRCLPRTFFLNSTGSLSHSSAASPFRGDALGCVNMGKEYGIKKLTYWVLLANFVNSRGLFEYCRPQSTYPSGYPGRFFRRSQHWGGKWASWRERLVGRKDSWTGRRKITWM